MKHLERFDFLISKVLISLQLCYHSVLLLAALYDPEGPQSLSQTDSKFISLMPSVFLTPLKMWTLYYYIGTVGDQSKQQRDSPARQMASANPWSAA